MKKVLLAALVSLSVAAMASAGIGTISPDGSIDASGYNVYFDLAATTTGFTSPYTNDNLWFYVQIYYPYTWTNHTLMTADWETFYRGDEGGTDWQNYEFNVSGSYSLAAPARAGESIPPEGRWSAYILWAGFSGTAGGSTTFAGTAWAAAEVPVYLPQATYTPDPNAGGNPIPTLSMPALLLLGLLMIGAGFVVLRRR